MATTIVYRPELENPPSDKECSVGFSFIEAPGRTRNYTIKNGVNRDVPDNVWEQIKDYKYVQKLLSLGALRVVEAAASSAPEGDDASDAERAAPAAASGSSDVTSMPLTGALNLIEDQFDVGVLKQWHAKDERIRIKNAIAKRIQALEAGEA